MVDSTPLAAPHLDDPDLEPIDRELLGPALRHVPFIQSIHRRLRRVYGLGGLLALLASTASPIFVSRSAEVSAMQLAIVALGTLLFALAAVGAVAATARRRLGLAIDAYCIDHGTDRATLASIADHRPDRWPFARVLLVAARRPLTSPGQVGDIEV